MSEIQAVLAMLEDDMSESTVDLRGQRLDELMSAL